jgi:hypothetical protein
MRSLRHLVGREGPHHALLAFTWAARDGVDLYAGYRTVEGGAGNEEVYNLAWLHYAAVGVRLRL